MSAIEKYHPPPVFERDRRLGESLFTSLSAGPLPGIALKGRWPRVIVEDARRAPKNGYPPFASVQRDPHVQSQGQKKKPEIGADLPLRAVKQSGRYDP